jgi:hypothetical protein
MKRMHGWVGRKDRQPVAIEAVIHRSDGTTAPVRLGNVSDQGCRIEGDWGLRIGERLSIDIPRMGEVNAQVRWALPDGAGVRFLTESDV